MNKAKGYVMTRIVFILIGMGLCVAAVAIGISRRAFIRRAAVAEGVVIRLNAGGSHPQIAFQAASGQKIEYPQGGLIFGYHPGDRVRVFYDPGDPAKTACIDAVGALWAASIFLSLIGVFCLIGGLAVLPS